MSEKKVALHFGPKTDPESHDALLTRAYREVIEGVRSKGHDVVITRGAGHYDFTEGVIDEHWLPETSAGVRTKRMGELALDMVGSIRDLGKLLRPTTEYPIPLLNGPQQIAYDSSKLAAYRDLLCGLQGITIPLEAGADEAMVGDTLIVKPDKGSGGRGVRKVARSQLNEVMDELMHTAPDQLHIVQEYVDMTIPFPADIKGVDEEEAAILRRLKDRKKELRVFTYRGRDSIRMIPIARMMKEEEETSDTWVFVDPDYIPPMVEEATSLAFGRLAEKTQTDEIFGAIDFLWGATASSPEPMWRAGEMNFWRPVVSRRKPEVARRHDQALSEQLVRMARGGSI